MSITISNPGLNPLIQDEIQDFKSQETIQLLFKQWGLIQLFGFRISELI